MNSHKGADKAGTQQRSACGRGVGVSESRSALGLAEPNGPSRFVVEIEGQGYGFDDYEQALGRALHTLVRHMHAPGTVVLVHRPAQAPLRLTLHKDRSYATVTL